jgi:bis(5'-nucleosyl)-tetraphosphatase (symmetrical)
MRWVIGDVHGCFLSLQKLLTKLSFSEDDTLYFVGDLINRGKASLETLNFIYECKQAKIVLGNHDIALLATASKSLNAVQNPCFKEILAHSRAPEWINWLKSQPLMIINKGIIVHAGLYPLWTIKQHEDAAENLHKWLSGLVDFKELAAVWKRGLAITHLEAITNENDYRAFALNVFTRMRFIGKKNYHLNLNLKGGLEPGVNDDFIPWFEAISDDYTDQSIIFGHWAALQGKIDQSRIIGIDTGCVWGQNLTAYNIDTKEVIQQSCLDPASDSLAE